MNILTRMWNFESVFTAARAQARQACQPVLAVLTFRWTGRDPLELYERLESSSVPCLYWETRDPELTLLGIGRTLELCPDLGSGFERVEQRWREMTAAALVEGSAAPRAIGGFRFDAEAVPEWPWRQFPSARLIVPRLLLERTPQGSLLVCQKLIGVDDDPIAEGHRYRRDIEALLGQGASSRRQANPSLVQNQGVSAGQWQSKAEALIGAIRKGRLQKVVLARHLHQTYSDPLSPAAILRRLRRTDARSHLFAVRHGDLCFLGATPERLVSVREGRVRTHALAGTIQRGDDPETDQRLGQQLLSSAKDLHEHELVVRAIRDALAPLVEGLTVSPKPVLHRLPVMQHLSTLIEARIPGATGILKLVEALQPTPAVAGYPKVEALSCIRLHEGFDRGWYAGPLGWIDGNGNGDFVVALRSALIKGRDCHLFAGCGLVADSVPEYEYQETCLKLSSMQEAV